MEGINDELFLAMAPDGRSASETQAGVQSWLRSAKELGISSVICLLSHHQVRHFTLAQVPLVRAYRDAGFHVAWIPVADYKMPPLNARECDLVLSSFDNLPKPVVVHCQAAMQRSPYAVNYILQHRFPSSLPIEVIGMFEASKQFDVLPNPLWESPENERLIFQEMHIMGGDDLADDMDDIQFIDDFLVGWDEI